MTDLNESSLTVTPGVIQHYGDSGQDWNPIHFDDEAGRAIGMPSRIAHGMIAGAVLSRMLTENLGQAWISGGELELTFIAPVLPNQMVTAAGRAVDDSSYEVWVQTEDGTKVIVGTASV